MYKFLFYLILSLTSNLMANNALFKMNIIENDDIDESSGLAASTRYENVLWTHNDSGSAAIFYAMDYQGKHIGTFFMGGEEPNDWEDMASFELDGKSYLLVADTGDNNEINFSVRLSVFIEPDVYKRNNQVIEPAWVIDFEYPKNKSYDVESVGVDIVQKKIILLSKRNKKVHVFELPLRLSADQENTIIVAKKVAKLKYFKRPTGMDISSDGKKAIILTYGTVYLFNNPKHKNWAKILKKPSKKIKFKGLYQPEGISFDRSAKKLYISSEKLPAKLLEIKIKSRK